MKNLNVRSAWTRRRLRGGSVALVAAGALACAEVTVDPEGLGGSGGSSSGNGGSSAGTGGSSAGTGGSTAGTGGSTAGSGGSDTGGSGGSSAGTGGSTGGSGGSTGGSGGSSGSTGGSSSGSGGSSGGSGGSVFDPDAGWDGGDAGDAGPPPVINLITNPDFESGAVSPWSAAFGGTLQNTTEQAHSGSRSGKVTNRTALYQGIHYNLLSAATPGTQYAVSAFARLGNVANGTLRLTLRRRCTGDGDYSYNTVSQVTGSSSSWSELSGTIVVPACTLTDLLLYVEQAPIGADIYLDDVLVTPL